MMDKFSWSLVCRVLRFPGMFCNWFGRRVAVNMIGRKGCRFHGKRMVQRVVNLYTDRWQSFLVTFDPTALLRIYLSSSCSSNPRPALETLVIIIKILLTHRAGCHDQ